MNLAAWFHCWTPGEWSEPTLEFADALQESGFTGPVFLGLIGDPLWCASARGVFPEAQVAVEADSGFEQVTLAKVREYALDHPDNAVLYCHSKGSADATEFRKAWRRSMTRRVVSDWRANLAHLDRFDAVGCHWLTAEQFSSWAPLEFPDGTPFFGGNFWMARCDYLRTLPEPSTRSRFDAERWIGLGDPRVLELRPGWPAANLFT